MEKRYGVLRIIGTVYKILGIIAGVATILAAIGICATSALGGAAMEQFSRELGWYSSGGYGLFGGVLGGILAGVFAIISGGALTVTLYAVGEGIYLLLALEENTRTTALLLQHRRQ